MLDAIQAEAERMTRMVGDLLLLAQAESGNLPLGKAPVELDTVMLEVYQQARVLAGGKVDVAISDVDQLTVLGDRDRLKQLMLNLVGNALQYTPEGGNVTITFKDFLGDRAIVISDTGIGVPKGEQDRVFTKLFRAGNAKNIDSQGTGLGLYLIKSIVKAMGGSISFVSEENKGSTFTIEF